jgi:four helix bundle protein
MSTSFGMRGHEHLLAWQVANQSAVAIHSWADRHWQPARASTLNQLRRSSLSVTLNIVEGFASGPGRRCRYHLRIAYASSVETTAILVFLGELGEDTSGLLPDAVRARQLTNRLWRNSPL